MNQCKINAYRQYCRCSQGARRSTVLERSPVRYIPASRQLFFFQ